MTNPPDESQPMEVSYHTIAQVGDLQEGKATSVRVAHHVIGLFLSEGEYYAISDFCPHQGASLSGGYVEEGVVMCPWHAWKFRLNDGAWADSPNSPLRCRSYPVRIVGDKIQVGVPVEPADS